MNKNKRVTGNNARMIEPGLYEYKNFTLFLREGYWFTNFTMGQNAKAYFKKSRTLRELKAYVKMIVDNGMTESQKITPDLLTSREKGADIENLQPRARTQAQEPIPFEDKEEASDESVSLEDTPQVSLPRSGIVTINEWLTMPDKGEYRVFFCENWVIVTDKEMPINDFRSSERWTLIGMVDGEAKIIIPGCKVSGMAAATKDKVLHRSTYVVGSD